MSKDLSISVLMDFYGGLLTDKQKEALELYYNQDFSLAEIAEHMDISRQGVRDFIKRGEKQLEEFESGLGLLARFSRISDKLSVLSQSLADLENQRLSVKEKEIVSEMKEVILDIENDL